MVDGGTPIDGSQFFTKKEVEGLDPLLLGKLYRARALARVPFRITSGKRSTAENALAGGVSDSSHIRGLAVDLACVDSIERFHMLNAIFLVGFTRVGVYNFHIHVDVDPTLPQNVAWVGVSH
jgi:zinc D-Ala-D-Ala carboxypeptidase